uniref:Cytochrome c biogenesis protein CcsA n=1 Tax=Bryopsis hypnoides TaxID=222885 RepID=D0EVT9_BRYHP|nr:cytochrome c biogenesis protein [Bryopsis hypnoides]ACX33781.1 cytochrome c biogenesis protein [Bryopsis hypnoides]
MILNSKNFIATDFVRLIFFTMVFLKIAIDTSLTFKFLLKSYLKTIFIFFNMVKILLKNLKKCEKFTRKDKYKLQKYLSWIITSMKIFLYVFMTCTVLKVNFVLLSFMNLYFFQLVELYSFVDPIYYQTNWIGCITAPTILFVNGFASFYLPAQLQQIGPLIPALKSNWLMMHVTVMLVSYAALISGCLLAIAFLIIYSFTKIKTTDISKTFKLSLLSNKTISSRLIFETQINKILQNLDNFSYRIIGLGFPFLTIGILSGAVWANEAWGSYWSWDPKETWALITWLIFAIYLHTRLIRGWSGIKSSMIASLGFIVVWICYLGVNLLGKGLHSYGWFT